MRAPLHNFTGCPEPRKGYRNGITLVLSAADRAVRPAAGIPWPPPLQTTFARQGSSQNRPCYEGINIRWIGGSFTAATFAAALHEQYTGQLTKAVTPLEAATRAPTTNTASVLISARGSNPDIMRAFQALRFKEPIAAICASERNALLRLIDESGAGVGYGFTVPGGKDGFLATNSLLATLILLVRSYDTIFGMPELDLRGIGALSGTAQDGLQPNSNLLELAARTQSLPCLAAGDGQRRLTSNQSAPSQDYPTFCSPTSGISRTVATIGCGGGLRARQSCRLKTRPTRLGEYHTPASTRRCV